MPPKPRAPSIVKGAPTAPERLDLDGPQSEAYLDFVARLSIDNEQLRAEVERLKGQQTYEHVRTRMMEPYAGKVFNFLVGYCGFVGAIILMSGFKLWGFAISDTVLGIIAGSTAASAIGLVGSLSAAFSAPPELPAERRAEPPIRPATTIPLTFRVFPC